MALIHETSQESYLSFSLHKIVLEVTLISELFSNSHLYIFSLSRFLALLKASRVTISLPETKSTFSIWNSFFKDTYERIFAMVLAGMQNRNLCSSLQVAIGMPLPLKKNILPSDFKNYFLLLMYRPDRGAARRRLDSLGVYFVLFELGAVEWLLVKKLLRNANLASKASFALLLRRLPYPRYFRNFAGVVLLVDSLL